MAWWEGFAASLLAQVGEALLLERATGNRSLAAMARDGRDDEASRTLCEVAVKLHAPRGDPPPELIALPDWFRELWPAAERHGGLLVRAAAMARELLDEPRDVLPLHGDLHHDNVLDFGSRGWLAIDPKHLIGERGFDFANLLRNPDFTVATRPGRLARQASVIAEAANLERKRLLKWTFAFAGLSPPGSWATARNPRSTWPWLKSPKPNWRKRVRTATE
jgi:streptomycin 6-kinase